MSSPDPNQQYGLGGFYQQPSMQYPDPRNTQGRAHSHHSPEPRPVSNMSYVQPHYGTATPVLPIAELPAPLPPAPPTSTPQQQMTKDELLAHKLQQMEVEEVRRRSNSNNPSHHPSQYFPGTPPSPHIPQGHMQQPATARPHSHSVSSLHPLEEVRRKSSSNNLSQRPSQYFPATPPSPHVPGGHLQQPSTIRPQSYSVSSPNHWGPNAFTPHPTQAAPSDLPEVVVGPRYASQDTTPGAQVPTPVTHQTAYLPPPPGNPASLSAYLEQYRLVPYPPQWILHPPIASYFGSFVHSPKSDWLDIPLSREWRTVRVTENASNPTPPSFSFSFKSKSGGGFRDPQYTWSMATSATRVKSKRANPIYWTYQLKMNPTTGLRNSESLYTPQMKQILTTYIRARNYDSLRFVGPDGRLYLWVTHAPLSSTNGARFDTLRHALFASVQRQQDPLYGEIVADHAYWDGFVDNCEVHTGISCNGCGASPVNGLRWKCKSCVDHDICESCRLSKISILPTCTFTLVSLADEALIIRSPTVDPELVVATLQVLKDWELHTIREQKRTNPMGFEATEAAARKADLGYISHWRSTDFVPKGGAPADTQVRGTAIKRSQLSRTATEVTNALGAIGNVAGSSLGKERAVAPVQAEMEAAAVQPITR